MSIIDSSPKSVAIISVYQQANMLPASDTWPILQPQQFASQYIFWNIIKDASSNNQFYIQDYQNRYLAPSGDGSCVLGNSPFAWKIVQSGGPVNLYNISEPSKPDNYLQSGYQFGDPANAYAVRSLNADPKSALASWVIQKVPN